MEVGPLSDHLLEKLMGTRCSIALKMDHGCNLEMLVKYVLNFNFNTLTPIGSNEVTL